MTDAPAYRLYTSEEAAERAGGGLTASFFERLAASRQVEATYAGHKLRWTDAQIAAAVAHHARGGAPSSESRTVSVPTRSSRASRSVPAPQAQGSVTPLRAKPGKRYSGRPA